MSQVSKSYNYMDSTDAIKPAWDDRNPRFFSIDACKCRGVSTTYDLKNIRGLIAYRPVPIDAVTTSNTKCGHWYKVQSGDTCDSITNEFDISLSDFEFLNPQLDTNCTDLWLGNSYVSRRGILQDASRYKSDISILVCPTSRQH